MGSFTSQTSYTGELWGSVSNPASKNKTEHVFKKSLNVSTHTHTTFLHRAIYTTHTKERGKRHSGSYL